MSDEEKSIIESSYDFIKKSFELRNLKLYKEAIEMLYKALNCDDISPKDVEITSQIGDLYFLLKNYDRAIEQYEKVLESDRLHKHTLFQMCKIYFMQKKYKEALKLVEDLCANSTSPENFVQYFKVMYELNMYEKMQEVYNDLDAECKNNEEILYIMSLIGTEHKCDFLKKTVEVNSNNKEAHFDLGVVYFDEKDYDNAKKHFQIVVENQKNAKAHNYLGLIYQIEGKFHEAIENFYKAVQIDKIEAEYFYNLAKAYIDIHWFDEAQTAIQKSLRLVQLEKDKNIDLGHHYYIFAWINKHKKNYKNALLNLDLIDKNSKMAQDALILRYSIDFDMGDVISAKIKLESLYEKEENKKNLNLLSVLGEIYKELKMYDKSINIYLEGLKCSPDSYDFLSGIAEAYIDFKDYDNAIFYTNKLREIYPTSADACNSYARIYYRKKQYKEAFEELEKLVKIDTNNAEAFYFMGLISNDLDNPALAQDYLKIALNLKPDSAKYYAQFARSYELLGSFDSALLYIKEAIDIVPSDISFMKKAKEYSNKLGDTKAMIFYENHIIRLKKLLRGDKEE
ncbi:MAG: tetratricopeptide repeat protein [Cyanobacteria bacterium SIG30]|nr:tetratricopeptide repeat protein [Cyanobacteria bacterium SIG30]